MYGKCRQIYHTWILLLCYICLNRYKSDTNHLRSVQLTLVFGTWEHWWRDQDLNTPTNAAMLRQKFLQLDAQFQIKCWSYSCSIWNRFGWKEILQKSPDISNKSNMLNASHPVLVDSFFFPLFAGFYRFQVVHGFQPWIFDFKAKTEDPSEATLDTQPGSNENRWFCCFKKCFKYFSKLISWLHPESFCCFILLAATFKLSLYISI